MGWSPRCYIASFVEIGPPVSEKKIFISLYLKAFIQNLVQNGTVVSGKIQFEFLYVHDLCPRSRNDLPLQYSHTFLYSIRCLLLLTFRSLAAIVSKKSTVFTFPIEKPKEKSILWYIYLNLFALPEHLRLLLTSIIVTNS